MGHPEINALSEQIAVFQEPGSYHSGKPNEWDGASLDFLNGDRVLFAKFQSGPIQENGVNGCGVENVIDLAIKRMEMHQAGPFACRENALVITKLQEARHWLDHRTAVRETQGVEGTDQPHQS